MVESLRRPSARPQPSRACLLLDRQRQRLASQECRVSESTKVESRLLKISLQACHSLASAMPFRAVCHLVPEQMCDDVSAEGLDAPLLGGDGGGAEPLRLLRAAHLHEHLPHPTPRHRRRCLSARGAAGEGGRVDADVRAVLLPCGQRRRCGSESSQSPETIWQMRIERSFEPRQTWTKRLLRAYLATSRESRPASDTHPSPSHHHHRRRHHHYRGRCRCRQPRVGGRPGRWQRRLP
eukprot:COSAG04_NODE_91_length_26852_cov_8.609315_39_plen_237_part_00